MTQLSMSLPVTSSFAEQDFVCSNANAVAYDTLMQWPEWTAPVLWLYGPVASGKSHLAAIWKAHAQAQDALKERVKLSDWCQEESLPPLLLDSIDGYADQHALFHLLNHVKHSGSSLLIVSRAAPNMFDASLPDLSSRICALPAVKVEPPDDALIHALFMKLFADRQMVVPMEVIHYLLPRVERSCATICSIVEQLDKATLTHQRKLSVPFVKSILQLD